MLLDPAHVSEILTVGKIRVDGIEAETITVNACIADLLVEHVGVHAVFLFHELELLDLIKMFNAVLHAVGNVLQTEVTAKTVAVDAGLYIEVFVGRALKSSTLMPSHASTTFSFQLTISLARA